MYFAVLCFWIASSVDEWGWVWCRWPLYWYSPTILSMNERENLGLKYTCDSFKTQYVWQIPTHDPAMFIHEARRLVNFTKLWIWVPCIQAGKLGLELLICSEYGCAAVIGQPLGIPICSICYSLVVRIDLYIVIVAIRVLQTAYEIVSTTRLNSAADTCSGDWISLSTTWLCSFSSCSLPQIDSLPMVDITVLWPYTIHWPCLFHVLIRAGHVFAHNRPEFFPHVLFQGQHAVSDRSRCPIIVGKDVIKRTMEHLIHSHCFEYGDGLVGTFFAEISSFSFRCSHQGRRWWQTPLSHVKWNQMPFHEQCIS